MSIASLLLVLITAAPSSASDSKPILLDFHAEWCGPCRQMRTAVSQFARKGYPVKSIDIDHNSTLRERYNVEAVPTFVVVDARGKELDRTSGSQPLAQLERFYLNARAKAQPPDQSRAHAGGDDEEEASSDQEEDEAQAPTAVRAQQEDDPGAQPEQPAEEDRRDPESTNPRPWESVVRIRVLSQGAIGYGSGTIIHSTPQESLILTCAHIFKMDGQRQPAPQNFSRKILIDVFDGKLHGEKPAQVHYVESFEGKAVDYDMTLDVGLIRMRPGKRLPASRVVPAHWEPRQRMRMFTVGCPGGRDATAWQTVIVNPQMRGLAGKPSYQAIECLTAPQQGRSGGGLYTTDGYVAGVCNFAEPKGDHGLYATPRSIYSILDRNNLMALYEPVSQKAEIQVAERGGRGRREGSPVTIARGQSPDNHEPERPRVRSGDVTVPPPHLLGVQEPLTVQRDTSAEGSPTRRTAWRNQPSDKNEKEGVVASLGKARETDLNMDPEADQGHFSRFDDEPQQGKKINQEDLPAAAPLTNKPRWRPSRSAGAPITEDRDR